jgi:hypothetical protein
MELHELEVLQRQAGAKRHGAAVTGAGVGRGRRLVDAAIAAGRQHHLVGAEAMDGAIVEVPGHDAAADTLVHDQVEGEVLDEELGVVPQRLLVERVQDRVAGAVGRGAGALGNALAVLRRHAAERALVDLALGRAAERHAVVFELDDRADAVAAHVFDRVLVAEPVGALDRVVHVPAPVVRAHVAQRRGDAALRRHGMAAGREHLGDAGRLEALVGHAEGRAKTRTAGTDDDHVVFVIDHLVRGVADVDGTRDRRVALAAARLGHDLASESDTHAGHDRHQPEKYRDELDRHDQRQLHALIVHVILDHDLHAELAVIQADADREDQQHHDERRTEP